jgi:hypothetical protein
VRNARRRDDLLWGFAIGAFLFGVVYGFIWFIELAWLVLIGWAVAVVIRILWNHSGSRRSAEDR